MTSNREKAAEIIYNYGQTTFEKSLITARALDAEGVLADDSGRIEYQALNRADEKSRWHPVTAWSEEWPFVDGESPDPRFDKVLARRVSDTWEASNE